MEKEELLSKPIGKLYAKFAAASILGMLGISVYILADTIFIANGIGPTGLAALNIALPGYSLVSAIGMFLGIGSASCYSLELGRGEDRYKAARYYRFAVMVGLLAGGIFFALGLFLPVPIARLLGATGDTLDNCATYVGYILRFAPAFILNQIYLAFVRNIDKPNVAMASMIAGSLFNVVMDYVTIYIWHMGMAGAALATGCSPVVGLLICIPVVGKSRNGLRFGRIKLAEISFRHVFSGGISSFIIEISSGIAIFILNALMLGLEGNDGIAAYGVVANMAFVPYAIFTGEGQALQPIASINYGAGKRKRMRRAFVTGLVTAAVTGAVFWTIGSVATEPLAAAFNPESDPHLQALTERGIALYFTAFLPMGMNVMMSYFFQSVMDVKDSVTISLLRGLILICGLSVLLAWSVGTDGVWLATTLTECITVVYGLLAFRRWKKSHASKACAVDNPVS